MATDQRLAPTAGEPPATIGEVAPTTPEAVAPPPGNPRFPHLDGMRALAALSVLVFHAAYQSRASFGPDVVSRLLAQLNVGVAVFFVISGFLMYRPLLAARAGAGPPVRIRDYARRRFLRIVPAYWVALTVLAIYPGLPDMFSSHWWVYYGFLQDYSGIRVLGGIDTAWTLGCEVAFYVLLPFVSIAFAWIAGIAAGGRIWWRFELAALAGLSLLSAVYRILANAHPATLPFNSFPATFAWFALGMLLALASVAATRTTVTAQASRAARLLSSAQRCARFGWPAGLVIYCVLSLALHYTNGNPFFEHDSAVHVLLWYALDGLVAICLVAPAVFAARSPTATGRLLSWRPLAWIGLISYGIYLYHNRLLVAIDSHDVVEGNRWLHLVWLCSATLVAVVIVAALSYYLVERPILRFKERPRLSGSRSGSR